LLYKLPTLKLPETLLKSLSALSEQNMEAIFLVLFKCLILMARIDTDTSTQLGFLEVDKKNLAYRSSHCQLPLLAHTRGWSPQYISSMPISITSYDVKPVIYGREV
jgi:hypothetical protein